MIKRLLDVFISFFFLVILSPILLIAMILIWQQDKKSPIYISHRVGKNKKIFNMIKLRSMVIDADKSGINSTSSNDNRITKIGHFIRNYKLDELMQLWNVLLGDMSLVGPRPNVKQETDLYTNIENGLLTIKPGITDLSSIIFYDEGEILKNKEDPDLSYNQLIRPWKSRLGLIYVKNQSLFLDLKIILYTFIVIFFRKMAINLVVLQLKKMNVDENIINVATRKNQLYPFNPPGAKDIVNNINT
jgi:lipopolysaccharide/colanic/teichoic acid biosynthesis glycosyltransferase